MGISCSKGILGLVTEDVLWQFLDFFDNDLVVEDESFCSTYSFAIK